MRFYLHFSVDEWQGLPWWQQRLYIDGLHKHKPWQQGSEGQSGETNEEGEELDSQGRPVPTLESSSDVFASRGIQVQQME